MRNRALFSARSGWKPWILWREETRDGQPTKVPYSPHDGNCSSVSQPETWSKRCRAKRQEQRGVGG